MKSLCAALVGLLSGVAQAQAQAQPAPAAQPGPAVQPAPAATYDSLLAEGRRLRGSHYALKATEAYAAAARLAPNPASKAFALGEVAEIALGEAWFRLATDSSCQALEILSGAPRASHLYNLARAAEAVSATPDAVALYRASLALRPNTFIAARLKALQAPSPNVGPSPATGDSASAFCSAALRPRATIPSDFPALAEQIAKLRGERVRFIQVRALGRGGEQHPVAFLCGEQGGPGAWIISVDPTHRYLVGFLSVGGRDVLDACEPEDTRSHLLVGQGRYNALQFYVGHRGGYYDYRVAVRGGRPVIVWQQSLEDARAGDPTETKDFDQRGRDYPSLDTLMTKSIWVLIDPKNLSNVVYTE